MSNSSSFMFFDKKPPRELIASWRDFSLRPGKERPDVFLFNLEAGRVLLLDAKYKSDKGGRVPKGEDLFEMQSYMNSFGVNSGGIVYPGVEPKARILEGKAQKIAEIPLRASFYELLGGISEVHDYVRSAVTQIWSNYEVSTCK